MEYNNNFIKFILQLFLLIFFDLYTNTTFGSNFSLLSRWSNVDAKRTLLLGLFYNENVTALTFETKTKLKQILHVTCGRHWMRHILKNTNTPLLIIFFYDDNIFTLCPDYKTANFYEFVRSLRSRRFVAIA